jgi:two-component system CheB/CheR fusion protein
MAREGLQLDLNAALRRASQQDVDVVQSGVRVKTNGDYTIVDVRLRRLTHPEPFRGLFLISFESAAPAPDQSSTHLEPDSTHRIGDLERELLHAKEMHHGVIEELETANEELKSTNEELQSTNEELQSANEELETSKEEMQSLNEELHTVNSELQTKVDELSRANDDMKNLLNGTEIATIFLDGDLNIKRFTEQARRVIRLIPGDIGRPIADIKSRLRYDQLVADASEVLRTLVFKQTEVYSDDGVWYLVRIVPYRTTENVIDGLVITFVDITALKASQEETRRFLAALQHSPTTVFGLDKEFRYVWACNSVFGRQPEDVIGRRNDDFLPEASATALQAIKSRVLTENKPAREHMTLHIGGEERTYDLYFEPRKVDHMTDGVTGVVTELMASDGEKP